MTKYIEIVACRQIDAYGVMNEFQATLTTGEVLHVEQHDDDELGNIYIFEVDDYGNIEGDNELIENCYHLGLTGELRRV